MFHAFDAAALESTELSLGIQVDQREDRFGKTTNRTGMADEWSSCIVLAMTLTATMGGKLPMAARCLRIWILGQSWLVSFFKRIISVRHLEVLRMNPGDVLAFLSIVVIPAVLIIYIANRFFRLRERKLEIEAMNAAEKAAQYASRTGEIEERLRVVEQIVTDNGVQTAAQIEALRQPSRSRTNRTRVAAKD